MDRAAMHFAIRHGIDLCGWCPKGGWAEDYPDPPGLLADYDFFLETPEEGPSQRTLRNMRDCDAILTIMPKECISRGTDLGLEEGIRLHKPMFTAGGEEDLPGLLAWLMTLPEELDLCIGGPRESEWKDAAGVTEDLLEAVFWACKASEREEPAEGPGAGKPYHIGMYGGK